MSETPTEPLPSSVPSTEMENERLRLQLQKKELRLKERQHDSWRMGNDTLTSVFKALMIPASILLVLGGGNYIFENNKKEILSMGLGCSLPPSFTSHVLIPALPPMSKAPDIREEVLVCKMDNAQLTATIVRMNMDRAEIRRRAKR